MIGESQRVQRSKRRKCLGRLWFSPVLSALLWALNMSLCFPLPSASQESGDPLVLQDTWVHWVLRFPHLLLGGWGWDGEQRASGNP